MQKQKANREFRKIKSLLYLYEINGNGTILRNVKSKKHIQIKLDTHHSKVGYYTGWVCIKGKVRRCTIHKLVAECWLGEKPKGYEIDHIDRNTHNNSYTNLRYVTHSEQMKNRVLSQRIIEQAKENCLKYIMEYVAKPTTLKRGSQVKTFPSMTQAAKYLGEIYNKPSEHFRRKFKQRRKHIYDYDVIYEMQRLDTLTLRGKE